MKAFLVFVISFVFAGCTWTTGPGETDKHKEHIFIEVYHFDIDNDSLHITFGHNWNFLTEEPPVEIANSHLTDRIMVRAEITGWSGGTIPYVYKYIMFMNEHTLLFYISGIWFEMQEKRVSSRDEIAAIQTHHRSRSTIFPIFLFINPKGCR
jgi:hypothetical protein